MKNRDQNLVAPYALIPSTNRCRRLLGAIAGIALFSLHSINASASVYVQKVLDDNPIALYRLLETSGTVAENSANPGVYQATYNDVLLNQTAPVFNGTNDPAIGFKGVAGSNLSVVIPTLANASFSVEFLFKDLRTQINPNYVFAKGSANSSVNVIEIGVSGTSNPANTGKYLLARSSAAAPITDTVFPKEIWRHVVMTFNYASDDLRLYIDGVQVLTASGVNKTVDGAFMFGDHYRSPSLSTLGQMADIAIYNRVLDAATVNAHYEALNVPEPHVSLFIGAGGVLLFIHWRRRRVASL